MERRNKGIMKLGTIMLCSVALGPQEKLVTFRSVEPAGTVIYIREDDVVKRHLNGTTISWGKNTLYELEKKIETLELAKQKQEQELTKKIEDAERAKEDAERRKEAVEREKEEQEAKSKELLNSIYDEAEKRKAYEAKKLQYEDD